MKPARVQIAAPAPVEGLGGPQQRVVERAQRGRRPGGRGQRPGVPVLPYGDGEPPGRRGGPSGHRLTGPGERGGGLGQGQRRGVLRVQPPLGGGTGVPPQPGSGERVLRVVEGGGERDAAGGGLVAPGGVEELGDGLVHRRYGRTLPVEPEVPGDRAGRRQREPQPEQPAGPAEVDDRTQSAVLRQRHPGPDRGGDEQLRTGSGRDGPDGTDATGDQSDEGEQHREGHGPHVLPAYVPTIIPTAPRARAPRSS